MLRRFRRALGGLRTFVLVLLAAVGSVAVLGVGFAAIVIVQIAASREGERIRGLAVPDVEVSVVLIVLVVASLVGVAAILGSEQLARTGATQFADRLRRDMLTSAADSDSDAVHVQDVRVAANSALVLSRLPGPVAVTVASAIGLVLLDPRLTLMLAPFALVMIVVGRRMRSDAERLSAELDSSRARVIEMTREANDDDGELLVEANRGDAATFRLVGQASWTQAAGLASVAIMIVVAVVGTDVAEPTATTGDIARLLIYVILARILLRSLQQITAARAVVARHAGSIRRCRAALVGGGEDSG